MSKFGGDRPVPGDRRGAGVSVRFSGDRKVSGLGGQALCWEEGLLHESVRLSCKATGDPCGCPSL